MSRIKDKLYRTFSSLSLAVALLILLAAVSVFGTFIPQGQQPQEYVARYGDETYRYLKLFGIIDLYHSWGFRSITTLLGINLFVCSFRRMKGLINRTFSPSAVKSAEDIKRLRLANELPSPEKADVLLRALAEKRYKVVRDGRHIYGHKGILGPWGDMVTHLSILVVLLGALAGSLGVVGTVNVYEGDFTREFYNWNTGRDEPLGFDLYVDKFSLQHYPVDTQIGIRERASGRKVGVFTVKEGGSFVIPGTAYKLRVDRLDFDRREAALQVYIQDALAGVYDTGLPEGGPQAPPLFFYSFELISFREPILKNVASTVRIMRGGELVNRAIVEVNNPMQVSGLSIYQTSFARDPGRTLLATSRFSCFRSLITPIRLRAPGL